MSNPRIPFELSTERPVLEPLEGKPLMVHVVVHVEHWPFEQPMPQTLVPAPPGREQLPDVPNFAWAEYGLRCGLPRILERLAERDLPASAGCNASVFEAYPACAEAVLAAGWEIIGHGLHQRSLQEAGNEQVLIELTLDLIERFSGQRPRGWLGPDLRESLDTPDLLRAADIDYVCDWALDDLPCWMETARGPLIAVPYSLELNDSVIYGAGHYEAPELYQRVIDTVAAFDRELKRQPRVLTLALHPHIIGVPHRINYLDRMLDHLLVRDDVIFTTGSVIADWFVEADRAARG